MNPDVENALNVVWGVSTLLDHLQTPYAQFLRDAVIAIKDNMEEPGIQPALSPYLQPPEHRSSPNHGGPRTATMGIILHGTRGGASSGVEYEGTLNWFMNPASQVSAHAVFAHDGRWCIMVDDENMAWHAGEHNATWLGVELEQPNVGSIITTAQYINLAAWCREMSEKYGFPLDTDHLVEHRDMPQGRRLGKTDLGQPFDVGILLTHIG